MGQRFGFLEAENYDCTELNDECTELLIRPNENITPIIKVKKNRIKNKKKDKEEKEEE